MKKMKTTMKKTTINFFVAVIFLLGANIVYADDWLDLVRKYTSADEINFAPDKWESLVNDHSGVENKNILAQWWDTFNDRTLTQLIEMAFMRNRDMQSSRARLEEARAQLSVTMSSRSPKVNGSGSWTHTEPSKNSMAGGIYDSYHLGFDASWELDLWGKKQDTVNAAKSAYEAEYATLHNSWVSLSAEVARNYINLRTLQERINVANKNIKLQQDVFDLLKSQYDAGLKDELALQQARYTLERTKSLLPALEQSLEATMNALAILTGEIPGSINELLKQNITFPELDVKRLNGIPANTIRQRPDILAAEKNLIAQTSLKKAAEKEYYPTISLNGSIGLDSLKSSNLFEGNSWGSRFVPLQISWPIFHGSEIRKNIKIQTAKEEQLLAAYESTVLKAVGEVRDALMSNVKEEIRKYSLEEGMNAARLALEVARDKYEQGLTDFNNVLTALQSMQSFEDDLTISRGQRMINLIALFKALGGGWQPFEQN